MADCENKETLCEAPQMTKDQFAAMFGFSAEIAANILIKEREERERQETTLTE